MRKLLVAALLAAFSVATTAAPPSDASIKTLLAATKAEEAFEAIYENLETPARQLVAQVLARDDLSQAQRRILEEAPKRVSDLVRQEMSWAKYEPDMLAIYRDNFTQAEVDELIAFYQSPVGRSFASKSPQIAQRSIAMVQVRIQQVMPKMQALVSESLAEARSAAK
jgi:hypothetical protein